MGSAVPAAVARLVADARTAVAGYTFSGKHVYVADGYPDQLTVPTLCVGLAEPPDVTEATGGVAQGIQVNRQWLGLGSPATLERFVIPCYADVIEGGGESAFAPTLQAASDIFDLIAAALYADRNLGGTCTGLVQVSDATVLPQSVSRGGQQGRRTTLAFGVACINEYDT